MSRSATTSPRSPQSGFLARLYDFVTGGYIDRDACTNAFARMHRRDAIGDRVMLILGAGGLVCLSGPVTMTEIALAPFFVFFFVRVINTSPIWIHGFGQPSSVCALALIAWMFIALIWSEDRVRGLAEIGQLRWLFAMGFLYPLIEKRGVLIGAFCVGVALAQVGQVLDYYNGFGVDWIAHLVWNHPGRISGWWHPVVGGGILVAAMGMHMPAALWGRGRSRWIGLGGLALSGIGVLATGTRGAWGAAALLCIVGVLLMIRVRRIPLRRVALVGCVAGVLVGISAYAIRDSLMLRINETRAELREFEEGDFTSYSGRRVMMAKEAINALKAHPVAGVGTGGYQRWCAAQGQPFGAHAHNAPLHVLSTLGIVGGGLWAALLTVILVNAYRWGTRPVAGPYAMGPLLGIVGMMLASLTDCVQINAQSVATLGVLVALCPAWAPGADFGSEPE